MGRRENESSCAEIVSFTSMRGHFDRDSGFGAGHLAPALVERYSITSRYDFPALKAALLKDASSNWTLWAKTRSASIAAIALSTNFSEGAFISRVPLLLRPRRASFSLEQSPRACARSRLR